MMKEWTLVWKKRTEHLLTSYNLRKRDILCWKRLIIYLRKMKINLQMTLYNVCASGEYMQHKNVSQAYYSHHKLNNQGHYQHIDFHLVPSQWGSSTTLLVYFDHFGLHEHKHGSKISVCSHLHHQNLLHITKIMIVTSAKTFSWPLKMAPWLEKLLQ